jgi:hypothetical protein
MELSAMILVYGMLGDLRQYKDSAPMVATSVIDEIQVGEKRQLERYVYALMSEKY